MKLKGLSDEHPIRETLRQTLRHRGPMSVPELAEDIGSPSVSQTAYHVRVLETQGYLRHFEREAKIFYEAA
jgi:predicted transcriptional regulator